MTTPTTLYTYDPKTGEHTGTRPASLINGKEVLKSAYATPVSPPASIAGGHVARWNGSAWEVVEDHRQHTDKHGVKQGGTKYWLPDEGDDWTSQGRYMEVLGPLPERAVLERPAKPESLLLEEARADKKREIEHGYEAAMAATLTMPAESPTAQDVAIGAALFAADDAEGLEYVQELHTTHKTELLASVEAAATVSEVQQIVVSYAV